MSPTTSPVAPTPAAPAASGPRLLRRLGAFVLGAALLVGMASGTASAKEIGSGGTAGSTTCNPVSSLTYKGDARAGETGVATITVSYGVKPCTSAAVVVDVRLYLTADPAAVAYADLAAPLNGKVTVAGVRVNTSYTATVTVYDATTGARLGATSIFAAARTKGV